MKCNLTEVKDDWMRQDPKMSDREKLARVEDTINGIHSIFDLIDMLSIFAKFLVDEEPRPGRVEEIKPADFTTQICSKLSECDRYEAAEVADDSGLMISHPSEADPQRRLKTLLTFLQGGIRSEEAARVLGITVADLEEWRDHFFPETK
jgi:hypothetical protein